jgi:hypothetical protein
MKNTPRTPSHFRASRFFPFFLLGVLALLFWRSFLPDYVHFSNDGPLGPQNSTWLRLPASLTGMWDDLNDIGIGEGTYSPNLTAALFWLLGPVGIAKFYAPSALLILGIGAWYFFRQLKLSSLAAVMGGLAAALNCLFFSRACWGVAGHSLAIGMDFFALALIVSNTPQTPSLTRWVRLALAGLAVGINVMEAADVGAIFSLFVAAFVFYKALNEEGVPVLKKIGGGILRVAAVALFAGFIATQTVVGLVGSSVTGIAGTGQDEQSKAANWNKATQWSLPKKETLALVVPGLFGYRMDTPRNMQSWLQEAYQGGEYWGGIGRDPALDRFFDSGGQGAPPPSNFMRFNGDGNYLGILVALLAAFAIAQSLRRENSPFTVMQKKFIWFWAGVMAISLLLAWGRFAPFYQFFYALPYVSTIRNPIKFVLVFSWAVVILSGFGVHVLSRRYLEVPASKTNSISTLLINWWTKVRGFDRNWMTACVIAIMGSLLAWLVYARETPGLIRYLQMVGFDENSQEIGLRPSTIATFSIGQAGWFILIFVLAVGLFTLIIAGIFSGKRAKLGGILLGALLVLDLIRADLPFIIHWDYAQKYEIGSLNPIESFLKDKPYEHRVAYGLPHPLQTPPQFGLFGDVYSSEWAQHHFPYYNIQSLDKIQMARMPVDLAAFEGALSIGGRLDGSGQWVVAPETFRRVARLWQLTNTRYLLGPANLLDLFNQQFDPEHHGFRIVKSFDVVPKPGIQQATKLEELTVVPRDTGAYALIEFTGALPRARLYSQWETNSVADLKNFTTSGLSPADLETLTNLNLNTNDFLTLKKLTSPSFDPQQTVLVSTPLPAPSTTNQNSGTVEFKSYAPKDIVFDTKSDTASVLLLNDRFDPNWSVSVDGKPAELLRCNFIMRGVYLPAGPHTVEFQFSLPHRPIYITLTAISAGIILIGLLIFLGRKPDAPVRA